jgi:peroxiredoxin
VNCDFPLALSNSLLFEIVNAKRLHSKMRYQVNVMRRHIIAGLALILVAGCASEAPEKAAGGGGGLNPAPAMLEAGADVPKFSLTGTDGKTYTPASLTEKGPAFVYFVKESCTANPRALPLYNELYKAYGEKITFVAVINSEKDAAEAWKKEFGADYVALLDPDMQVIKAFGLDQSQHTFLINKDGKIDQAFHGFGQDALDPLSQEMAKIGGGEAAKLDFSNAPRRRAFG